jgi:hypothetical protein
MSFLERQVVKIEIVNKHHEDWLGWEPAGESFVGKEFEVYRDCETEGDFKKAVGNLARRVGGGSSSQRSSPHSLPSGRARATPGGRSRVASTTWRDSRRYRLNGGLPADVQQALRELEL